MFQKILALMLLSYNSYTDLKMRLVSLISVAGAVVLSLAAGFFTEGKDIGSLVSGAAPGIVLLVLSRLSQGAVGEGDAYIFIALGIMLGIGKCMYILIVSLVISSMLGIALLIINPEKNTDHLPFIPFVLLSFLWCCL
ncbi:MAG: prepilin peptidase [Lachnospiraceae bacterium]|nr:prepilin peptidase [Lachnospiraceae bacterium]